MCGGRDFSDVTRVYNVLKLLDRKIVLVNGQARGADTLAAGVRRTLGGTTEDHPADWYGQGREPAHYGID